MEFKQGDLIIPNGCIENAFYYKTGMTLMEDQTYRVGNKNDVAYFKKYVENNTMCETKDINSYMTEKRKYAASVAKDEDKARQELINKMNLANSFLR